LRAVKKHEFVNEEILNKPGDVDLSVDVDFELIKKIVENKKVNVFGPKEQGKFLKDLGIDVRVASLLAENKKKWAENEIQQMVTAYDRLVDTDKMGTDYKALALCTENIGVPSGFVEENL